MWPERFVGARNGSQHLESKLSNRVNEWKRTLKGGGNQPNHQSGQLAEKEREDPFFFSVLTLPLFILPAVIRGNERERKRKRKKKEEANLEDGCENRDKDGAQVGAGNGKSWDEPD